MRVFGAADYSMRVWLDPAKLKARGMIATDVLDAIREQPPDGILLDWMMPELDGPETCRQLKSDPGTASIPVIFLTAKSQEAEIQRGLSLGAAGYVTKPFDALALGQQIKDIVAKKTS